jgi:hypothetical protein
METLSKGICIAGDLCTTYINNWKERVKEEKKNRDVVIKYELAIKRGGRRRRN